MTYSVKDYTQTILKRFGSHGLRFFQVEELAPGYCNVIFMYPRGFLVMPFSAQDTSLFRLNFFLPKVIENGSVPATYQKALRMVNALNTISLNAKYVLDQAEAGPLALPGSDWLSGHLAAVASGRPPSNAYARIVVSYSVELFTDVSAEDWCTAFDAGFGTLIHHLDALEDAAKAVGIEFVEI